MVQGPPETHIEPSNTFRDAMDHGLDISLKGAIVIWDKKISRMNALFTITNSLTLSCSTSGTGSRHHVTMPISQQCGHC